MAKNEDIPSEEVEALRQQRDEMLLSESFNEVEYHWLSFADPSRPKGQQFLGAVLVLAAGFATAVTRATILGLNPGGEVVGASFPPGPVNPNKFLNRLLNKAECAALDRLLEKGTSPLILVNGKEIPHA